MVEQVEVHFHGIEKSQAIEQRVRQKVARLEKHFDRMTSCRVGIEASQRTPQKAKVFLVKIEIGVPRRSPIIISHAREGSHAAEVLMLAIRDAFDAAKRKVDGAAARLAQRTKVERSRRRPRKPAEDDAV